MLGCIAYNAASVCSCQRWCSRLMCVSPSSTTDCAAIISGKERIPEPGTVHVPTLTHSVMGGDIALLVDTGLCGGEICAPNDGVINVQVMKVAKIAMCAI